MSNVQNITQPIDLSTTVTKVLAIGRWTEKSKVIAERLPIMVKEVPATVELFLAGHIEQWWVKADISGPVFIMNATTTAAARELLEALPLGVAGMMEFDLVELGPLTPLRFLL